MKQNISYPNLPIVAEKERIIDLIQQNQVLIVAGDTGSGKTTQLPKMCLEAGLGSKKIIGCTQPRRIAATTVAARVAEELGPFGREIVGWKIRFRNQTTRQTRIKFMTDGVMLAEAQHDQLLRAYEVIIIDEAHERSLNIDFLLGILARLLSHRPDLKLIITSATIDTVKFSAAFKHAPIVEIPGRLYPVETRYFTDDPVLLDDSSYIDQAVEAVMELRRNESPGDILVFMPTERDIRETIEILNKKLRLQKSGSRFAGIPHVMPLFGRLSAADQTRVFRQTKGHKIVVATNVAETSVTVPGIRYVVDTGLARILSYNVRAGTTKLPVSPISRSSCDQRAGRCGRLGPGICVRLYSEENYRNRPRFTLPEILRANLAEVILRMAYLRLGDPGGFPFVDPPKRRAVNDGYKLLIELGALNGKRKLTPRGKLMARLPLDPRISRMIIEAGERNALREVCIIAAALSIQDPRVRPAEREKEADAAHERFVAEDSDFLTFINLWQLYHSTLVKVKTQGKMRKFCKNHFLAYQRMREWRDIHEQIISILAENSIRRGPGKKQGKAFSLNKTSAPADAVHQAVLAGNLRHIARKKKGNLYQGAGQREMTIFPGSTLFNRGSRWIMAAELVETGKLYARCLAPIKVEWLEPLAGKLCRSSYSSPHWQKKEGRVVALEKVTLFGLIIVSNRRVNYGRINRPEAREIFIQSALVEGEYGGRPPGFLKHNLKLIKSLEGMEDRLRRRDIMVDDYTLYEFYDQRLPPEVWDRNSFISFSGKDDKFLFMSEDDLLNRAPGSEQLADFPRTITCRDVTFKLQYNFSPGSEDDGVTVIIPVDLLAHVRSEFFEWLVPGLLEEKIIFLLKGLPKSIRRQLIPLPRTAGELRADLVPYQGSLYRALESAVYDSYRLRIDPRQWPVEIPVHLRMRFKLTDGEKTLALTRNFAELAAQAKSGRESRGLGSLRQKWERGGLGGWDFNGLEETITCIGKNGEVCGYGYPGLVKEDDDKVAIRIFADPDQRREQGSQGIIALYAGHFTGQLKQLKKDLIIPRSQWPLYEGIAGHEEINQDIYSFILLEIFSCRNGIIPPQQQFNEKITRLRENLYSEAVIIFNEIRAVLEKRRQLLDYISNIEDKVRSGKRLIISLADLAGFREQAADIVPPDFLKKITRPQLLRLPVYLEAGRIRLERRLVNPAGDRAKEAGIRPFIELARSRAGEMAGMSSEQKQMVAEFAEMVAEFRISVFAPELKTAFSVSEKKLMKKWREIEFFL